MAYDLGTARGVIEIGYNGRGVSQAKSDLKGLGDSGSKSTQVMDNIGGAAGKAGLAIVAGLGVAVASAANFEQRMSAIQAVSGATSDQMDQLRNKSLQLGKDTIFSAGEAASAIEELIKAGLSVHDVMNGAADATVNLAAAGQISIPEAATIAANAMNQFNLAASDMPHIADNIAGAANASAIDVGDFGQSLQQVGAVAHLAGADFHDVATAIAIMGNAGIRGSDAGTSLKTMLQRLQPTTEKQAKTMQALGIITKDGTNRFYDQQGRLKSLAQVSQILQSSLHGMTQQQKQATLQVLFGQDAIRSAAVLTDAGAKGFNKMATAMGKVSAADVAKTRLDNFKGSLEQLKGSLETAGITIGSILLPPLRQLVDALTGVFNWFLNLSDGTQRWVAVALVAAAGILLLVAGVLKMIVFIGRVVEALQILRDAEIATWLAALGPIGLIIAAIAAVVAIFVILWNKSSAFRGFWIGLWNGLKGAAQAVASWFSGPFVGFFQNAWNAIQNGVAAVVNWIRGHWELLLAIFGGPLGAIIALVHHFWPQITAVFRAGLNVIKRVWGAVWHTFGPLVKAVWNLIVAIIKLAWTIIKGLFILELRGLQKIWTAVWHAIVAVVRTVWNIIKAVVRAGVNAVKAVVTSVWHAIEAVSRAVWNAIMAVVRAVWARIGGTVMAAVHRVQAVISAAWNAVKAVTSSVWNAVVGVVRTAVGNVVSVAGSIKDRILGFFSGAGSWLLNAGKQIIQGLINGITSMINNVTSAIKGVTSKIAGFLPGSPVEEGPLKKLNHGHAGAEIVRMVITGLDDQLRPLASAADRMAGTVARGTNPATPTLGVRRNPTGSRRNRTASGVKLMRGSLTLTPDSHALIYGLAQDVYDDNEGLNDSLGRMG